MTFLSRERARRGLRKAALAAAFLSPATVARAQLAEQIFVPPADLAVDSPTVAVPAANPDPDFELSDRLKEAEGAYEEGLRALKDGQDFNGRAQLKRAFAILADSLDDERLPLELKPDFLSMVEKIRTWERPGGGNDEPSELDVSAEDLASATPARAGKKSERRSRGIPVDPENPITRKYIHLYTQKRPASVEQALARSGRYRDMIEEALRKARLPRELFYLVMTESEYKLDAVSRSGAGGLWQFMPFTARRYGLEVSYWIDERFHPEKATTAALQYLRDLNQWFGDWHLALAAYNRGENGLARDMAFTRSADVEVLTERNGMPSETHHYVPKFMACVLIGESPADYGLKPDYEKPPDYDVVALDRDLDLGIAAQAAGTTKEQLHVLNPHIRTWCTPKNRTGFEFRIPKGSIERFWAHLAGVKDWNPGPELIHYKVQRGDFLGKIASRYRSSVASIVSLNRISNPRLLRPGMQLKIKPGKGFYR